MSLEELSKGLDSKLGKGGRAAFSGNLEEGAMFQSLSSDYWSSAAGVVGKNPVLLPSPCVILEKSSQTFSPSSGGDTSLFTASCVGVELTDRHPFPQMDCHQKRGVTHWGC